MKRISTYFAKPGELRAGWRVIDVSGLVLGRVARDISLALQGKDKATYTAHVLTGDFVVVVNASKVRVTGNKLTQKTYYRHSGYVGNLRSIALRDLMEKNPQRVIRLAVKGMLPKNNLGRQMLTRLKIYPGEEHPHQAQVAGQVAANGQNSENEG